MKEGLLGEVNRRGVIALIVVLAIIIAPLGYLYLTSEDGERPIITVSLAGKPDSAVGISLEDLLGMDALEGDSSYQNNFGNWRGHGHYKGVLIRDLVEMVYQMGPDDNITIYASDGYNQTYCHRNVYNTWDDTSIQGDMILAYEFNGTRIPEWDEGPMVVFLPGDGTYSNDDLLNTSCPGQGGHVYLSAGARWVQEVESIIILPHQFSFAVVGDTQGNSQALGLIVDEINARSPDFVLHLGDTVPFPTEETVSTFAQNMSRLEMPWHVTPGNHDVKNNTDLFNSTFGTGDYRFDYRDLRFISLDTSSLTISDDQFEWLVGLLESSQSMRVIVFTHVPSYDPRSDGNHTLTDQEDIERFRSLMEEYAVQWVLSGHIHLFNHTTDSGVNYAISGGGGARLYASEDEGGFHHFLLFNVTASSIDYEIVRIEPPEQPIRLEVIGASGQTVFHLNDLLSMDFIEREGSFQNQFGNWRANGVYRGVLAADLIGTVGGMSEDDTLRIEARDGYSQDFCYRNVYPDPTWHEIQGDFIIAYAFNGEFVPDWADGLRSAFLPEDGQYSNEDCKATSCSGQGWNAYQSAGARFVSDVVTITVIPG